MSDARLLIVLYGNYEGIRKNAALYFPQVRCIKCDLIHIFEHIA
ncbi:hypothetical protein VIBHAR_01478 [Vibrio campbellii ATCC BAA-1116]|uniref:Uncharacterized protein n=1 Tax=Vibrio campbellii (strain ATCC BAA-1116) TaxID=2902295 RepID=A7MZQ6_VIBC1|nr:hypothetical protein VIBHAR_01478 [Vibrio campbellii ATCC BAA-1116]